ncbi:MAG: RdgB/HAM1 family non-canonical purine NTP pyrophosphatase [Alphaproteobacteria bacterium]|nr:RdgB/HAM1 family non-canonical purine NTP pyrophosphatase [Alphaproteobacteria bacterium]
MNRRFSDDRLVIASHNEGKVREIADLLAPLGIAVVSAGDLGLPEPVEDGVTFVENAVLKAKAATQGSGLPALADDSGLAVTALDGAPGIYSARWAEGPGGRDFDRAMSRVHSELDDSPDRSARFVCVLALAWPDGQVKTFEGEVAGEIVWPPQGARGFGYDPIFRATGHALTFGEIDPAEKHAISHRAVAFQKMLDACFGNPSDRPDG